MRTLLVVGLLFITGSACADELTGTVRLAKGTKRIIVKDLAKAPGHAKRALRVAFR